MCSSPRAVTLNSYYPVRPPRRSLSSRFHEITAPHSPQLSYGWDRLTFPAVRYGRPVCKYCTYHNYCSAYRDGALSPSAKPAHGPGRDGCLPFSSPRFHTHLQEPNKNHHLRRASAALVPATSVFDIQGLRLTARAIFALGKGRRQGPLTPFNLNTVSRFAV